jgi:ubiquinone/menaquinone biosynthesis C-methylase UbiE
VSDKWADWIRTRRSGGDREYEAKLDEELAAFRDKVLDRAHLEPGETLLDVGCGNGLIGVGALERGAAEVIFSDVSAPLLDDCREFARGAGLLHRCRFVQAPAEDLGALGDESVDVVTTRSVLIYVKDKTQAFAEFHRLLRPGGRISLFEPINRFGMEERGRTWGFTLGDAAAALMTSLTTLEETYQGVEDPMLDFDERDLLAIAEQAGFFPIELEYRVEIKPLEPRRWEPYLHSSGNPKIPTLAEAMDLALTPDEQERLVAELRPAVEEGRGVWRMGTAYLSGVKPR